MNGNDKRRLRSAHGYIELCLFDEAAAEIEEIDPFYRHLPECIACPGRNGKRRKPALDLVGCEPANGRAREVGSETSETQP